MPEIPPKECITMTTSSPLSRIVLVADAMASISGSLEKMLALVVKLLEGMSIATEGNPRLERWSFNLLKNAGRCHMPGTRTKVGLAAMVGSNSSNKDSMAKDWLPSMKFGLSAVTKKGTTFCQPCLGAIPVVVV